MAAFPARPRAARRTAHLHGTPGASAALSPCTPCGKMCNMRQAVVHVSARGGMAPAMRAMYAVVLPRALSARAPHPLYPQGLP
jgi:hypothetical protein